MPTDEPANRYIIYESRIKSSFDQEHQGRHISIKFGRTFYILVINLSKHKKDVGEQIWVEPTFLKFDEHVTNICKKKNQIRKANAIISKNEYLFST